MEEKLCSRLKKRYTTILWSAIILISITTFLLVTSALTYFDIIIIINIEKGLELLFLCFAGVLEIGIIIGFFCLSVPYIRDYKRIKNKEYRMINGIVLRFDFYDDGAEPPTTHSIPVIQDSDTGEILKIELDQDVDSGETYLIYYLQNTKTAVVAPK